MAITVEIRNTPENGIEAIWTGSQGEPLREAGQCVFVDKLSLEDWIPVRGWEIYDDEGPKDLIGFWHHEPQGKKQC